MTPRPNSRKSTYRGKPLEEYTKDELIVILEEMGLMYQQQLKSAHDDLDFALDLAKYSRKDYA